MTNRLARGDLGLALALFAGTCLVYLSSLQALPNGDGCLISHAVALGRELTYPHPAYPALGAALARAWPTVDPLFAFKLLSALGAATSVSLAYVFARLFEAGRAAALVAALLLGLSAAEWYFATTVELHAFHAGANALCALILLALPWRRTFVALFASACLLPWLFFCHQSALVLGLGWLLWIQLARARQAAPFPPARLVAIVPFLGLVFACVYGLSGMLRSGRVDWTASQQRGFLDWAHGILSVPDGSRLAMLAPLGVLLALAAPGPWILRHESLRLWTLLALCLPCLVFFLWWGVEEQGGYFLQVGHFLAIPAALALQAAIGRFGWVRWLLVPLVAGQAVLGWRALPPRPAQDPARARVEIARELGGERGLILSTHTGAPSISLYLPRWTDRTVMREVLQLRAAGLEPERIDEHVVPLLHALAFISERLDLALLLDVSEPQVYDRLTTTRATAPYMRRVGELCRREFETRELSRAGWTILRISRPRESR